MERLVSLLMRYELKRSFRRVCWVGAWPEPLPERPVVLYANHHHFYDGYLLWLITRHMLQREGVLWMEEWDRFPFFAAVGAHPFPRDDRARRLATIRRTARFFRTHPKSVLGYLPEGQLHPPEEGILPFGDGALQRLDRIFGGVLWWPVAIHVTWCGDKYPTAFLAGGTPHTDPDGSERERLEHLWHILCDSLPSHPPRHTLLDGRGSPSDTWSFSFATRFFERYL